ncbi:hypothetical protein MLD38_003747 [Melastoma candidum]|uniref:Uncharacterized protein n=1 Tax=Melastoma candidum TaxID=119954 RepID=A0ACB9S3P2_9MYRT|nr:hypothetical protein MLD38_003747 [Melastoma candidum]
MSDLELPGLPHVASLKLPRCEESHAGLGSGTVIRTVDVEEFPEVVEDGCRTPTSEDSKIPAPSTCPPAPRKTIAKKRWRTSEAKAASLSLAEIEEFFREIKRVTRDQERIRPVVEKDEGLRERSPVLHRLR